MKPPAIFFRYFWLLTASLLVTSLMLPGRYGIPYPQTLGPKFDPIIKKNYINDMAASQPQIVLIGDSFLFFGVDQKQLTAQLDVETYNIAVPGSSSAAWYLAFKNMILAQPYRPKYVIVFFRDTMLTLPAFRTTGQYFELLDDFAGPREPLVTQLTYINQMSLPEKLAEQYFPLYSARWEIRKRLDARVRYDLPAALLDCPSQCADDSLNSIFGKQGVDVVALNNAVADSLQNLYTPAAMDFNGQVDKSFLPHMIQKAQDENITLIFVRTKTLLYPDYANEPPALRAYIEALKSYLSKQDHVLYMDFAHDNRIKAEYFSDVLHFNAAGKAAFTKLFAEKLKPLLTK